MAIELKGNLKKALGFETIVLSEELSFELTNVTPKEVKEYQEIFFNKYAKEGDKFKQVHAWFVKFFKDNRKNADDMDDVTIEMLVAQYLFKLIEQFSLSFRLMDKEKFEEAKIHAERQRAKDLDSPIN